MDFCNTKLQKNIYSKNDYYSIILHRVIEKCLYLHIDR